MNRTRHTQGLTLIEILVVIGIIGIITAASLSGISKARKSAYAAAAGIHGGLVYTAINGFMSSRPGVTAAQIVNELPRPSVTNSRVPNGYDCTNGYALGGVAGDVTATPTDSAPANSPAWSPAGKTGACVVTTGGTNAFAANVYTWSTALPDVVYLNGKKQ